ncbi:MAG TPA: FAD-dependent monooxygenase [Gaiellaceae bacterium]|nr:FAD-dependent monooxygenase [Gaiellaceae bacterium]
MEPEHDVVVVGARVAGASLAILLARQGRRVLLLDRDAFPSDTLSTHYVAPDVVARLDALGVLDGLLEAGFRRVTRHRTVIEDCVFEGPAAPGDAFSLAPRRNVLDSLLQERAVAEGAELRTRTAVERLLVEDGAVVGVVAAGEEIRARVVVGADGKASKVAEWVGAESYREVPAQRPGYFGYFHGVAPQPEPTLELHFGGDTIGFLFPMRPGEDCLALEVQPEDFDTFRADPLATFLERYSRLHGMEARLRGATLEGKLKGVKGVANYFRVPYGPGWALTGDAGYLKDFATGLGIGDAVGQAFWLADALGEWLDGADWDATMHAFHERRDATLLPAYEATLAFVRAQDPPSERVDVLRALLGAPSLARTLGSALPESLASVLPGPRAAMAEAYAADFRAARERRRARA